MSLYLPATPESAAEEQRLREAHRQAGRDLSAALTSWANREGDLGACDVAGRALSAARDALDLHLIRHGQHPSQRIRPNY